MKKLDDLGISPIVSVLLLVMVAVGAASSFAIFIGNEQGQMQSGDQFDTVMENLFITDEGDKLKYGNLSVSGVLLCVSNPTMHDMELVSIRLDEVFVRNFFYVETFNHSLCNYFFDESTLRYRCYNCSYNMSNTSNWKDVHNDDIFLELDSSSFILIFFSEDFLSNLDLDSGVFHSVDVSTLGGRVFHGFFEHVVK